VEKSGRRVNGRLMESTIFMVWEVRGVKGPGIHVVRFYQPICKAKGAVRKDDTNAMFSSFNMRPAGKTMTTELSSSLITMLS
jgi:hypothetical protein